jgi:hypothetical protein
MVFRHKYKLYACLIAGCMLLASACGKDWPSGIGNGSQPSAPEGRIYVGLYTQADDFQQPASRAANEQSVDGGLPWVFVFSGSGGAARFVEAKQATLVRAIPHVMLQRQHSAVTVLVLANAPATFGDAGGNYAFTEANLMSRLLGTSLSELQSSPKTIGITSVSSIPYDKSYLPMLGQMTLPNISSSTSIGSASSKISLHRIVAKVSIYNTAEGFTPVRWTVAGTRNATGFLTAGVEGSVINFDENIATPTEVFYLYPSAAGEASVILKGNYGGSMYYYKLGFSAGAGAMDLAVEGNQWYQFNITAVTGPGHASFAAAVASASQNILATVSVIDPFSFDIKDNGLYYIGVSHSQLLFYGLPEGTVQLPFPTLATVATTATASMTGGVNFVSLENVTPEGSISISRANISLSANVGTPAYTNILINTLLPTFSSADMLIRLGTLTQVIELRKVSGALSAAASVTPLHYEGNIYTSAKILFSNAPWLYFSTDGAGMNNVGSSYTQPNAASLTPIYICAQPNTGSGFINPRYTELLLSRQAKGLTKVYVQQGD